MADAVAQAGNMHVGRDLRPVEICARTDRHGVAVAHAELVAHDALAAVAADDVARDDALAAAGLDLLDLGGDPFRALGIVETLPAEAHIDAGKRLDVPEEIVLDEHLVGAQQRFGHLIGGAGLGDVIHLLALGRHLEARELEAGEAREIADIGRMIGGQPEAPQRGRNAEPPVMLHRARVLRRALRVPARRHVAVEDEAADPERVQAHRQGHADRPAADDQDRRGERGGGCGAGHVSSSLFFTLTSPRAKKLS